jgi:hypothetical protein
MIYVYRAVVWTDPVGPTDIFASRMPSTYVEIAQRGNLTLITKRRDRQPTKAPGTKRRRVVRAETNQNQNRLFLS